METISVNFVDFWPNLIKEDNYFYNLLSQKYRVIINENDPDILFHSVDYAGRQEHRKYDNGKTLKLWFTGENQRPDYNICHASLSFDNNSEKNYRLPLWVLYVNWFDSPYNHNRDQAFLCNVRTLIGSDANYLNYRGSGFCSFVATQNKGRRSTFVPALNKVQQVACGGRLFNNVKHVQGRGDQLDKLHFLMRYRFNVAMENCSRPGYLTEKILHAFAAGSVPIYWGDELASRDFNVERFINAHNFADDESLIDYIMKIDLGFWKKRERSEYMDIVSQPIFPNDEVPECARPDNVLKFIEDKLNA